MPYDYNEEPTKVDLPELWRHLRSTSPGNPQYHNALIRIEFVLQTEGLLPIPPERPSERAMRVSAEKSAEATRTLPPPDKT